MSVSPPEPLRELHDQALASITGHGVAEDYERGAIEIAWGKMLGSAHPLLSETLRVDVRGGEWVPAHVTATIGDSIQTATARLVRATLTPDVDPARKVGKEDRRRAEIVQEAQIGNVLFFKVQATPSTDLVDVGRGTTPTHDALATLIGYLPRAEDDDAAVDGILGGDKALRLAVKDVSEAARAAPKGLDLALDAAQPVISVLTRDRADALSKELGKRVDKEYAARLHGLLDGLRGSRHVVYLVTPTGDVAMSAADDLLWAVRQHLGKQVTANVTVRERETVAGRKRTSYTLRSVQPDPDLDLF